MRSGTTAPERPSKGTDPLRIAGFRALAAGYTVNALGTWIGEIALAVLVYDRTGSPLATAALFMGMQFLPAFASQALIARAEMIGTRVVLPLCYLVEAALFWALAVSSDNFFLPLVLILAAFDGTVAIAARAFVRAGSAAVLTPMGLLREGNAIFNIGYTVTAAAGPALGGLAVAWLGVKGALYLDVASFVIVAVAMALTRSLPQIKAEPSSWLKRLRDGISYVRSRRALSALIYAQAAAFVFFTAVVPVEIVYAKDTLDAGNAGYGVLLSAWGLGMVLGSFLFAGLRQTSIRVLLAASTLAIGCAYLGMAAAGTLVIACIAAGLGGLGNGVQWVALLNAVQEMTAGQFQARVVGLLEATGAAMPGIGFLVGGAVAAVLDPRAAFVLAGCGVIAVLVAAVIALRGIPWPEASAESADTRVFPSRAGT
jgi:Transmembrane secretion effector